MTVIEGFKCDYCYADLCYEIDYDPGAWDCDGITVELFGRKYDVCDQWCKEKLRQKLIDKPDLR